MDLIVGKVYDVKHSRKGNFRLRVKQDLGDIVTGEIIAGTARQLANDDVGIGEEITVRKLLATFTEVPDQEGA